MINDKQVHGLSKELLSQRKVEIIDIAAVSCNYWSKIIGTAKLDFSMFISQKTQRGPLSKGWQSPMNYVLETCNPVMTSYKLVTMDAPIWGIGGHLEEAMIASEKALLSEFHKLCFAWIDEWFGMTMGQIMEMEKQNNLLLQKTFQKSFSTSKQDAQTKSKHETQKIVDVSSIVPV
ncbi:hypothetical protein ZIOFF_063208 [Zingiber officinale]|uniref:Phosphatidylinositol transfer protein N-terminal domain-containing protein n=1 Tax=Zingiber officinale TaxID=94328 RepID=A0A8J5F265_ZINOF|nr:hypothetical protein ZIOFF_063208 [Zingiber officinale]